ncbi:MAG: YitT family protein [Clostridiales bacterium]|nr:YitT family protein [Clostridiales bacterium]
MFRHLKVKPCAVAVLSSALLAFGLYNVHSVSGITEGGVLGMTLFLQHWLGVSPAYSDLVLNLAFYILAWRLLGNRFLGASIVSAGAFCVFYKLFEQFDPLWPSLADKPLLAAIVGAVFIGCGAGFCVRMGGAPGGDDALAMSLAHLFKMKIQWAYLILDVFVLALSATYIPLERLGYSLLTVVLSGQIIGLICRIKLPFDTPLDIEEMEA